MAWNMRIFGNKEGGGFGQGHAGSKGEGHGIYVSGGRTLRAAMLCRPSWAVYGMLLMPVVVLSVLAAAHLSSTGQNGSALAILGLGFWAVMAVVLQWPTKFLALVALTIGAGLFCMGIGLILAMTGHDVVAVCVACPLIILCVICCLRIGSYWGGLRYRAKAARGRPILEWEWVYVGREAALNHVLAKRLGANHALGVALALWLLLGSLSIYWNWGAFSIGAAILLTVFVLVGLLSVVLIYRKHPAAWPLGWVYMVLSFPFSLPFMIYWADGARPNLIYRHRYERLVAELETQNV